MAGKVKVLLTDNYLICIASRRNTIEKDADLVRIAHFGF